jgi:hypothetical protein
MKTIFKKSVIAVIVLSLSVLSLSSCKKKEGERGSDKFPLTNLTVAITSNVIYPSSNNVIVSYDIKNISGADYTIQKYQLNPIKVRVVIGTTDGTSYQANLFISDVQAGKTVAMEQAVGYGAGKTVDLTKTKVELIY